MANLNINLQLTNGSIRWGLIGLLIALGAAELSSESVTLSTYYPAPSGIYRNIIATNDTLLARDSGGVGIGTRAGSMDPSAALQVDSTSRGFLPPRMNAAGRNGIPSPAEGLVVYDTDAHGLRYYNGGRWRDPRD